MKWDWGLALSTACVFAAKLTHAASEMFTGYAILLDEDHDARMDEKDWANALGAQLDALPTTEGEDG